MDEGFFQQVIETTGIALIVLDDDAKVVLANPAACAFFECDSTALVGHPVAGVMSIDGVEDLRRRVTPQAPSQVCRDVFATTSKGAVVPLSINVTAWQTPQGGDRFSIFLRGIRDELEIEKSAHDDMTRASSAIRGANIGVFEYDVLTHTAKVSDIWREALEIAPGEDIDVQEEWQSRVYPADLDAALAPVQVCIEDGLERMSCEYRLYTRDRSALRWIKTDIAVADRDADGNVTRLIGAQQDITDRMETDHALRESVDQFRSAFHNAPIGKAIMGLDGRWSDVNAAFCALLGFDHSALIKIEPRTIVHPEDLHKDQAAMAALIAGEQDSYEIEKRYLHASGKTIWGSLSMGMVRDAFGQPKHFIVQIVDVTEQRRLQDLKSEFIATVSHELRTPVTSILGALKLLSARPEDHLSEQAQKLVGISLQNSERLKQLVNDILDFEKFSVGKLRFDMKAQNVASLVAKSALQNGPYAESHNVNIVTDLPLMPTVCNVDPARLTQVITNLLSNAAKFSYAGGVIDVRVTLDATMVRVCISNQGDGIPEAFHDKIFKPFSQAASVMTRSVGGTGLGLSISKQIIEHLGGQIGFDSVEGAQTDFWFTLPLAAPNNAARHMAIAS